MVRQVLKICHTLHHYLTLGRDVSKEKLQFFVSTEAVKNYTGGEGGGGGRVLFSWSEKPNEVEERGVTFKSITEAAWKPKCDLH